LQPDGWNWKLEKDVIELQDELVSLRRKIHKHPELSLEERRTAGMVADYLDALGNFEVIRNVGGHGVIGILNGQHAGKTIAIRADMDALPIQELADEEFRSVNAGVMHACGHDCHTAIGLITAKILVTVKPLKKGRVVFIFQPAEEIVAGARMMLEDNKFDWESIDECYGLHVISVMKLGVVGITYGPMLASADRFDITIEGKAGHGGMPQITNDTVVTGAHLVNSLQTIVSRNLDPLDSGVVSVGMFHAGEAPNAIAGIARLEGTIRTYSSDVQQTIFKRMGEICKGVGQCHCCNITLNIKNGIGPTINHHAKNVDYVKDAALRSGFAVEEIKPLMAAEDFSMFVNKYPGAFFFVGASPDGTADHSHHSPKFRVTEEILAPSVQTWLNLLEDRLQPNGS